MLSWQGNNFKEIMADILTKTKKSNLPEVHPGDIVRVHQKIKESGKERIQVFEGIVIKTHGKVGPNATFTVRKIASGVGVEKTYPLQSPNIIKVEFKKGSAVNRAKLYYLRNLSGKALKLKEKKIDQEVWELVAKVGEEELTAEHLEEAIKAAGAKAIEAAKSESTDFETVPTAMPELETNSRNNQASEVVAKPEDDTVKTDESNDQAEAKTQS